MVVNKNKNLKKELKRGLRETRGPFFWSIDVFSWQGDAILAAQSLKINSMAICRRPGISRPSLGVGGDPDRATRIVNM